MNVHFINVQKILQQLFFPLNFTYLISIFALYMATLHKEFIPNPYTKTLTAGETTWRSPSNIALVKYWGKRAGVDRNLNLPAVGSLSMTLDGLRTVTTVAEAGEDGFVLDGLADFGVIAIAWQEASSNTLLAANMPSLAPAKHSTLAATVCR